eukprot:13354751-Alexandrium_andersonii.AAC.1
MRPSPYAQAQGAAEDDRRALARVALVGIRASGVQGRARAAGRGRDLPRANEEARDLFEPGHAVEFTCSRARGSWQLAEP